MHDTHLDASTTIPLAQDDCGDPEVRDLFARLRSTAGFVPNLVRLWGRAPHLLPALVALELTVGGRGRVPQALKELAMTRTSELNSCPYCKSFHHARLRELGVPAERSGALAAPELDGSLFTEEELAVLRLADEMTLEVRANPATVDRVRSLFGDDGAVELMAAVALLNFDNRMAFTANLPPDGG